MNEQSKEKTKAAKKQQPKKDPPWKKGRIVNPRTIVGYGNQGSGKTYFAASDPNALILSVDNGADELDFATKWRDLDSVEKVQNACKELLGMQHEFKYVGLDTLTKMMMIIEAGVIADAGATSISDRHKLNFGLGHIRAAEKFAELLKPFTELRDKQSCNLIILCHERLQNEDDPDADEAYMKKVPDVHWRINRILEDWATEVFWFGRNINIKKPTDDSTRAEFDGEVRIFTTDTAGHVAKNRLKMDASIKRDWSEFKKALTEFAAGK